jgi:hypothetical protein
VGDPPPPLVGILRGFLNGIPNPRLTYPHSLFCTASIHFHTAGMYATKNKQGRCFLKDESASSKKSKGKTSFSCVQEYRVNKLSIGQLKNVHTEELDGEVLHTMLRCSFGTEYSDSTAEKEVQKFWVAQGKPTRKMKKAAFVKAVWKYVKASDWFHGYCVSSIP